MRIVAAAGAALFATIGVSAQSQNGASEDRQPLGSTITVDALANLPSSQSLTSLIDVSIPEVVGDGVDTGGLTTGQTGRLGAHGSSWTQTMFKMDGIDVTAPNGSGAPLFVPGVEAWEQVDVATGRFPIDVNAPGLAILMTPRRSTTSTWRRSLDLMGSPAGLNAHNESAVPPPISRLDAWAHANLTASGPVVQDRIGAFLSFLGTKSSRFDRGEPVSVGSSLTSIFSTFEFTPSSADRVRLTGLAQRATYPFENRLAWQQPEASTKDISGHLQVRWDRQAQSGAVWSGFGVYSGRGRSQDLTPSDVFVERLRDGTVPLVATTGAGGESIWSLGGQYRPAGLVNGEHGHTVLLGAEINGAGTHVDPALPVRVGEFVNGLPARLWDFSGSSESSWHSRSLALYAADAIDLGSRVRVDAGLRFEAISASADQGTTGISWHNFLPRAGIRIALSERGHIAGLVSYGRYGYRLALSDLAWGDSSAPVANVFRWTGTSLSQGGVGPVVQRIGPGTSGDPGFSAIDPNLSRPYMDDMTLGFEARPRPSTLIRLVGIARRDGNMLGVVNVGAPQSAYSITLVADPGVDLLKPTDDNLVPVYDRKPATFGADRYLLTNPPNDEVTYVGVDFSMEIGLPHMFLIFGGTAGRSEGIAASRGFLATENDAAILGEAFTNPNARTNAQGRLFTERGYTGKIALTYRLPQDFTLGLAARYMDGQHFARILIEPDLNQGPEAIRAFQNGKTRFTFVGTLDVRLQKAFNNGPRRVTGLIDAYNLLNTATEIEEFPVTGADPRLTSSVQPPRSVHVGIRVDF